MFTRYLGGKISSNDIKKLEVEHVDQIFRDPYVVSAVNNHIAANGAVVTKALANKLARAHFYMLKDQLGFQKHKLFAQS